MKLTFCFIQQKIITSTKSQTSNTIFLKQHKECLNCYTWLIKKVWNIKILCTWIVNSYILCKNKLLFPDKLDWHFYSWTRHLQLCTSDFFRHIKFCMRLLCMYPTSPYSNWICCFTNWLFIYRHVINGSILWQRVNWLHVNTWSRIPYQMQVYEIVHLQKS